MILLRFDCDLSQDVHDQQMTGHGFFHLSPSYYYKQGLSDEQKERIATENEKLKQSTRNPLLFEFFYHWQLFISLFYTSFPIQAIEIS